MNDCPWLHSRCDGMSRRTWLQTTAAAAGGGVAASLAFPVASAPVARNRQAQIAITLDLEMSRNFPDWESTHWDYQKGNLNEPTKEYAIEAARRVKSAGGVVHFFVVGQVFEQPSVAWLKSLVDDGHPVGNHTYDHVNITANKLDDIQYRFQRAPWLADGMTPPELIRNNIRLCSLAMQKRLDIHPHGFRTPGGFSNGLRNRPDLRALLLELGFSWVSSLYPPHPNTKPRHRPDAAVWNGIVAAQALAQPFAYPDGLIEIPMSPISDIGAFRNGRWDLEWFLTAVRKSVTWTIEHRAVFDFLGHPSCLYVRDPEFKTIDTICEMVREAGKRAALVDLGTIARTV